MKPAELDYRNLQEILRLYSAKGRSESASFLNWFLENIYRLDETDADDAICDRPNDKGIDGLHVDHVNFEIHVFQGKVIQNPRRTLGDRFDYKADLKSPLKVDGLKNDLVTTYEKDIARKKADRISDCWVHECKRAKVSPDI